ncbi:hypothetical protein ACI3K4_27665 [Streptomyces sp. CSMPJR101]|uniref:hypothetical protein n=1 Tax=Streptomyces sp. CSMPJR101 TaxID=1279378 RepID=UPI0038526DC9
MEIAGSSTEYVHVNVVASIGGTPVTLASPPKLAFLPVSSTSNPETEDWLSGEWSGSWARILIGPNGGGVTLDPGKYSVWISFAAGSETPVYRAGDLTVY